MRQIWPGPDGLAGGGTGRGGELASRAFSWAWLLAGQAVAVLGMGYLAAAARLGWQSPSWTCARFLSRSCQDIGMQALHDIKSAVITAVAGVGVLAVHSGRPAPGRADSDHDPAIAARAA